MLFSIYTWIRSFCRRRDSRPVLRRDDYEKYCTMGDLRAVEYLLTNYPDLDCNTGLRLATEGNHSVLVNFFLCRGATNLDECLKIAVEKGMCILAEMLVQKGAQPIVGISVSKFPNITHMLYRYDTGGVNKV